MSIIQLNQNSLPTLYKMAMDYLPIQATSVPSERVFSSAADTDTKKRNHITPALMEALQILKFAYRRQDLSFTLGWSSTEADIVKETNDKQEDPLGELLNSDTPTDTMDELIRRLELDDE